MRFILFVSLSAAIALAFVSVPDAIAQPAYTGPSNCNIYNDGEFVIGDGRSFIDITVDCYDFSNSTELNSLDKMEITTSLGTFNIDVLSNEPGPTVGHKTFFPDFSKGATHLIIFKVKAVIDGKTYDFTRNVDFKRPPHRPLNMFVYNRDGNSLTGQYVSAPVDTIVLQATYLSSEDRNVRFRLDSGEETEYYSYNKETFLRSLRAGTKVLLVIDRVIESTDGINFRISTILISIIDLSR